MKYTNLGKLILKNESRYWDRMFGSISDFKGILGKLILWPLLIILVTPFHWIFTLAHVLFETWVYFTDPLKFEENIKEGLRN